MTVKRLGLAQSRQLRLASARVGWIGVWSMALIYGALYLLNFQLELGISDYTTRIWFWSQSLLTLTACFVLWHKAHLLRPKLIGLGATLGLISGATHALHNPGWLGSLLEGGAVWLCLMGGGVLMESVENSKSTSASTPLTSLSRIPIVQLPWHVLVRSLALGVGLAIPLSVVNNLFFYLEARVIEFQPALASALTALSPAISEEIVFRFFVLALCFYFLRHVRARRLALATSLLLAVVPHSLNHLPDLFLHDPTMALFMLTATSLLFGLPMALLQVWRNLETAITFHWFIDFARFWFGY